MSEPQIQNDLPARAEQGDRVLTGGSSVEALEAVMERHAPAESEPPPDPVPTPSEPPQPPDPNQPQKLSRGAKRFEALTAEREAAKREAAAERERRESLEREIAKLKSDEAAYQLRKQAADPQPTATLKPQAPQPTRAKPTEDEVGTKYQTYADFVEDLSDWKTEQRMAAIDLDNLVGSRIDAYRARQGMVESVGQTYTRGREKFADFDAVLTNGPGVDVKLGPTEEIGNARIAEILRHPQAEYILYAIGRDATVAQQLGQLSDIQFGYALSRIVPMDPAVAQPASTGIPSPVIAPAPYQPVGSGSKTTVLPSAELAKKGGFDYDKSGYREKRAAERGVRRR